MGSYARNDISVCLPMHLLVSKVILQSSTHRRVVHIQPRCDRSIHCRWNVPFRAALSLSVVINEIRRKLENSMCNDAVLRASVRRRLRTGIRLWKFDFWPCGGVVEQGTHRVQLYRQMPDLPPNSHTPRYTPGWCNRSESIVKID